MNNQFYSIQSPASFLHGTERREQGAPEYHLYYKEQFQRSTAKRTAHIVQP